MGKGGRGGKQSPGEIGVPTPAGGPTSIRGSLARVSSGTGAVDVGPPDIISEAGHRAGVHRDLWKLELPVSTEVD